MSRRPICCVEADVGYLPGDKGVHTGGVANDGPPFPPADGSAWNEPERDGHAPFPASSFGGLNAFPGLRLRFQSQIASSRSQIICDLTGVLYLYGQGVGKDSAKARYWFQKAAEAGNADATNVLRQL